jgi:DNA-binding transcriptional ArsR family regulator
MTPPVGHPAHLGTCIAGHPGCECRRQPGRRARRGWVRTALLALLVERPMHGYEMISELADRTGGAWRPSPGSVYPTLQALEDDALVTVRSDSGKRLYTLTDAGRRATDPSRSSALWDSMAAAVPKDAPDDLPLRESAGQLIGALDQVLLTGTSGQKVRVAGALDETRRTVYRILAAET